MENYYLYAQVYVKILQILIGCLSNTLIEVPRSVFVLQT